MTRAHERGPEIRENVVGEQTHVPGDTHTAMTRLSGDVLYVKGTKFGSSLDKRALY